MGYEPPQGVESGKPMNEVMEGLTIIATILPPLPFLVGVYGMNFNNLPELSLL